MVCVMWPAVILNFPQIHRMEQKGQLNPNIRHISTNGENQIQIINALPSNGDSIITLSESSIRKLQHGNQSQNICLQPVNQPQSITMRAGTVLPSLNLQNGNVLPAQYILDNGKIHGFFCGTEQINT